MKVAAVVVVVALIAVGNLAAKRRQHNQELAAQDKVFALALLSSTTTQTEVQLLLTVRNGGRPLRIYSPRITSPGFTLVPADSFPYLLPAGATYVFVLRLHAPCQDGQLSRPVSDGTRLLVPVTPPSGTEHELSFTSDAVPLPVLAREACGLLSSDRSVTSEFSAVKLEKYAVSFTLHLTNQAPVPVTLNAIGGAGLAVSVQGGLPIDVAPYDDLIVPGRLSVPSCAGLPAELDSTRPKTSYAPFYLGLIFDGGRRATTPATLDPGTPLYDAIRALARSICPPGSFRSGPARRGGGAR